MEKMTSDRLYQGIGKNVAKYRKIKKISQLELSLLMGYKSVSVVSSAEINYRKKHFNLEQLLKISYILEVDLCDLLKISSV